MTSLLPFPNGARVAVSLTYDDGLVSHVEDVAPNLERRGLRGTFNLFIARRSVTERVADWRALAARGHELGNHTLFHPCRSTPDEPRPFVGPYNLAEYSERRLREELGVASCVLNLIDGNTQRTFANPCYDRTFGPERQSMDPLLADYFVAARSVLSQRAVDLEHLDFMQLGSAGADRRTFAELRAQVEGLAQTGGWIIYTIHGVGEGTHNLFIDYEEHRQFTDWLSDQRARIWTAPMIDVVRALKSKEG